MASRRRGVNRLADNEPDQRQGDNEPHQGQSGRDQGGGEQIGAREAAQQAVAYVDEMTGQTPEVVSGVEREQDGWLVTVELLELARIPDSSDVLGCYQVGVDYRGEPVSYRRVRRYQRGQVGED